MISHPRLSIRTILFGVLLIAGDCAALKMSLDDHAPYGLMVGMLSVLPMFNILAVASYRSLTRRTSRQPFLIGFEVAGSLAMLVCFHLCLRADDKQLHALNLQFASFFHVVNVYIQRVIYFRNSNLRSAYYAVLNLSLLFSITTLPQMFMACSGGWVARWCAGRSRPSVTSLPPLC